MTDNAIAKGCRHLAVQCLEDAKNAQFTEIRDGYQRLADSWLKLARETELVHGSGTH